MLNWDSKVALPSIETVIATFGCKKHSELRGHMKVGSRPDLAPGHSVLTPLEGGFSQSVVLGPSDDA